MKTVIILLTLMLAGCATGQLAGNIQEPVVAPVMMKRELDSVPAPAGKPLSVAVYGFTDKTGQRRPQANIASLSFAVTQGAETFLIKALQDVGGGQWFDVVERVGIDNLTRERQLIRQMREAYEGAGAKPLQPMKFAGIILEGGIIGYDSSTKSGGAGARWLGIGAQTQYSEDIVTISLRAVSVSTGAVLVTVTVQKTILSAADSMTALKFFNMGTKAFEAEAGVTVNEPGTYAVKSAIELAVVELIREGERKGLWQYRTSEAAKPAELKPAETKPAELKPAETKPAETVAVETKPAEIKPKQVTVAPPKPVGKELKILDYSSLRIHPRQESLQSMRLLKPGTVLPINKTEGEWYHVTYQGRSGWLHKSRVEIR